MSLECCLSYLDIILRAHLEREYTIKNMAIIEYLNILVLIMLKVKLIESTSRYCIFVRKKQVIWRSKKQIIVAWPSAKVEYCVMAHTCCELLWFEVSLRDFDIFYYDTMGMHCDNKVAIIL